MKNNSIQFGILAYRSNGERVYYVNNPTQGANMLPYAASLARKYTTKQSAKKDIPALSEKWIGLTGWAVFQDLD